MSSGSCTPATEGRDFMNTLIDAAARPSPVGLNLFLPILLHGTGVAPLFSLPCHFVELRIASLGSTPALQLLPTSPPTIRPCEHGYI